MKKNDRLLLFFLGIVAIILVILFRSGLIEQEGTRSGENDLPPAQEYVGTTGELVLASLEAYGGSDRIRSLKTLRLENLITVHGQDGSKATGQSTEYYKFPDMVRVDFRFDRERVSHFYDGVNAWIEREGIESKGPDFLAESLRRSAKHFPMTLLSAALSERSILSPVGTEDLSNKRTLAFSITDGEGDQSRVWLDAETLLIARMDYIVFSSLGADSMSVMMADYREIDGIQTAFQATIYYNGKMAQETKVKEAVYNPDLPDSLFKSSQER